MLEVPGSNVQIHVVLYFNFSYGPSTFMIIQLLRTIDIKNIESLFDLWLPEHIETNLQPPDFSDGMSNVWICG